MIKLAVLCVGILLMPVFGVSQNLLGIDFISPFNEDLAAIKKGDQWAFINNHGEVVIDYRDDIVVNYSDNINYPIFRNNRCLISEEKEGITYFGYIDSSGTTIIRPQFLNATNFENNTAIVLNLIKDTVGNNNIFKKPVVRYGYIEVAISPNGEITHYLTLKPNILTLSKKFIKNPPEIKTKLLSDNLMAVWSQKNKWEIKKIVGLE